MGWIVAQERVGIEVQQPTIEIWAYGLSQITCWADLRQLINDAHTALEHIYEQRCQVIAPEHLVPAKGEPGTFRVGQDSSCPSPDEGDEL